MQQIWKLPQSFPIKGSQVDNHITSINYRYLPSDSVVEAMVEAPLVPSWDVASVSKTIKFTLSEKTLTKTHFKKSLFLQGKHRNITV